MSFSFSLIENSSKWIPIRWNRDGPTEEANLCEVLLRAHEIAALEDPSPLITVALHRLLIALVHRTQWPRKGAAWGCGPKDHSEWGQLWENAAGAFRAEPLEAYFAHMKDRLDLFSLDHPFYQCIEACFDQKKEKRKDGMISATKLVAELPSGDNKLLFDHTSRDDFSGLTPNEAARNLMAFQSYDLGGLIKRWGDTSAKKALLCQGACTLVQGESLFETLMLNIVPYDGKSGQPFAFDPSEDCPAWEAIQCPKPQIRKPKGYLDYLTWQSRRVNLQPELMEDGQVAVRQLLLGDGFRFPDGSHRRGMETMMAFRKIPKAAKNQDPWPAVEFQEGFGLWRDSMAFLQSFGDERRRPKTLDWLANLVAIGCLSPEKTIPLAAFGLDSNQASVNQWCRERLSIPMGVLKDDGLLDCIAEAVTINEKLAEILIASAREFIGQLRAHKNMDKLGKGQMQDTSNLLITLAPDRYYWSRLDVPFREFLYSLPASSAGMNPSSFLHAWFTKAENAAWQALQQAISAAGEGGWGLKAAVNAVSTYNFGIAAKGASHRGERKERIYA